MAKVKVTIDTGTGGELRDYEMDVETLRRMLGASIFNLEHLRKTEAGKFPRTDRYALEMAERIRADFRLW